jgi:hypothetical protein
MGHGQGDAQEEGQSRDLWRRVCINTHEHTIALAIRLTDQIRYARRECELDALKA